MNFARTYEELQAVASMFWPAELSEREAQISIVPLLLKTQDQFASILGIDVRGLESLYEIVEASRIPTNLFLKHLVILADFGGEPLQRISREHEFASLFPDGKLQYYWRGCRKTYTFRALPQQTLGNKSLHIDGKSLAADSGLDDLKRDAIAILLFGSQYAGEDEKTSLALSKCEVGEYLGKPAQLLQFMKQRYIWVSRITGGAMANNLGQLAQQFVKDYITDHLSVEDITVQMNGRLAGISHTDDITGRETAFDLVVSNGLKYSAVEVSFQVTTNSTFERKAGQARSRYEQVSAAGHRIAYVVDGAGNFEREQAMRTILSHSHCSVAFAKSELDVLCSFLRQFFEEK